ncbi:RNA polymerase sigma factor [Marinifilum caeruleilacunae]|uniref:Sigma-70 family RNA polymerase sigma factor n=1 Tax=Marinifilum caeruleilacunae TaxID=2499076 RepID=A0ABX1X048_9BACT|nr:sigma-70 family RNA polymerase sigma factor [Marinifilum caeruleilacunae]NOU61581.1 sigma-70 family RNA polymerase sigma factor [Marinifilum caeruleilacunae]
MDYTTEAILEGISMSNNDVLNYIYKKFFPSIRNFIENNNGNEEDARDLFQEAIIVIYRKMKKEPLVLSCNFKTYIYSICKLLWLKQLEKKKNSNEINSEGVLDNRLDEASETFDQTERYRLYQKHFQNLGPDCKKVLQLALDKISLKEIAEIMGYKSEKYAKKRKYQCKQMLIDSIKSDNEFKEVYDE